MTGPAAEASHLVPGLGAADDFGRCDDHAIDVVDTTFFCPGRHGTGMLW
ncbi:hypothetical protein [Nocardia halotolerans]